MTTALRKAQQFEQTVLDIVQDVSLTGIEKLNRICDAIPHDPEPVGDGDVLHLTDHPEFHGLCPTCSQLVATANICPRCGPIKGRTDG